mmetsp:Transcript_23788/g.44166  ORF Transcript_23788/g.44166 Transcript_23788/m.44166 type:complete len:486 (+) Transcript_23788:94-1551(+)
MPCTNVRWVRVDEDASLKVLEQSIALNEAAFPPGDGEAASVFEQRSREQPDLFWAAVTGSEVVAFVNGTCTTQSSIEQDTMTVHEDEGSTLVVQSLAVKPDYQKQGLGRLVLRKYLETVVKNRVNVSLALLLTKGKNAPTYESVGFSFRRKSPVVLGKTPWLEYGTFLRSTQVACVNAFSDPSTTYTGNPAAVCVMPFTSKTIEPYDPLWAFTDDYNPEGLSESWMQKVAMQMNLSETAFLRDLGSVDDSGVQHAFELRWLTPTSEVDLCGHATMASAFALWSADAELPGFDRYGSAERFVFHTRSGKLFADRTAEGHVSLKFPATNNTDISGTPEAEMAVRDLGLSANDVVCVVKNKMDICVEVASDQIVYDVKPDLAALAKIKSRAFSVTSRAGSQREGIDIVARLFGPAVGIDEDPFTGSMCTYLATHWAPKLEKSSLTIYQASKRGGKAIINLDASAGVVELVGDAELSWKGSICNSPFVE